MQTLRYQKTILWLDGKTQEDIHEMIETRSMKDYPVKATNIREAKEHLKDKIGLQTTGISRTDRDAIGKVLEEHARIGRMKPETNETKI